MFGISKRLIRRGCFSLALAPPITRLVDYVKPTSSLGDRGERAAERFLLKLGWVIVERGYTNAIGEIDIIAVDDQTVVFVEVKTRTSDRQGHPAEAVDDRKQQQLTRVALSYMKWHHLKEVRARFDVIAITWPDKIDFELLHYRNAFEPVGKDNMFG